MDDPSIIELTVTKSGGISDYPEITSITIHEDATYENIISKSDIESSSDEAKLVTGSLLKEISEEYLWTRPLGDSTDSMYLVGYNQDLDRYEYNASAVVEVVKGLYESGAMPKGYQDHKSIEVNGITMHAFYEEGLNVKLYYMPYANTFYGPEVEFNFSPESQNDWRVFSNFRFNELDLKMKKSGGEEIEDFSKIDNDFNIAEVDGEVVLVDGSSVSMDTNIAIPARVSVIADAKYSYGANRDIGVFENHNVGSENSFKSITLPENLLVIGSRAFYNVRLMGTNLIIPNQVETIGAYAFAKFNGIHPLLGLVLPYSLIEVGEGAFKEAKIVYECDTLIIPEYLETIGDYAFADILNLKTVVINCGGEYCVIGDNAFTPDTAIGARGAMTIIFTNITPPDTIHNNFAGTNASNVTVYVPNIAFDAYSTKLENSTVVIKKLSERKVE